MRQSGRLDSTELTRTLFVAAVILIFAASACSNEPDELPETASASAAPTPALSPSLTVAPSPTSPPSGTSVDTTDSGAVKVPEMDTRRHLERADEAHKPYNSVPATSGPHFPDWWRDWGVVDEELPDELVVHNMEHGGVIIRYDCPNGCPELVSQLANVTIRYQKVILSPYSNMGSRIALTAWTYLDKFDDFDEGRIVLFIETHMNSPESPEPLVFP